VLCTSLLRSHNMCVRMHHELWRLHVSGPIRENLLFKLAWPEPRCAMASAAPIAPQARIWRAVRASFYPGSPCHGVDGRWKIIDNPDKWTWLQKVQSGESVIHNCDLTLTLSTGSDNVMQKLLLKFGRRVHWGALGSSVWDTLDLSR